jgi:hypothetical protein
MLHPRESGYVQFEVQFSALPAVPFYDTYFCYLSVGSCHRSSTATPLCGMDCWEVGLISGSRRGRGSGPYYLLALTLRFNTGPTTLCPCFDFAEFSQLRSYAHAGRNTVAIIAAVR